MKPKFCYYWLIAVVWLAGIRASMAQNPVITSFSQNGVLVCSNLNPGSVATVVWASSLAGPWQSNWAGLSAIPVGSNGTIQVSVPIFYRVVEMPGTNPYAGMAFIPAGSFMMGDTLDGESDAIPTNIYVSAFYMDTNLVSYSLWQTVYNWAVNNGYGFDDIGSSKTNLANQPEANQPVQSVNWCDCVKWCNARSQQAGLTPVYYTDAGLMQVYTTGDETNAVYVNWAVSGYRLPTEAEWEKAARGGLSGQRFPWGDTISESQANYYGDTDYSYDLGPNGYNTAFDTGANPYSSPVGSFAPNGYGLYDMAGNVVEWCWDWYGMPYGQPTTTNPTGPVSGLYRVFRGGSWINVAYFCRTAFRNCSYPTNAYFFSPGFRSVLGQ